MALDLNEKTEIGVYSNFPVKDMWRKGIRIKNIIILTSNVRQKFDKKKPTKENVLNLSY